MQARAVYRFGEARATYTVPHPVLDKTPKPNFHRSGSLGTLTINAKGFRGRDFSEKPGGDTVRVFCLGSSVVFGGGGKIGEEDTIPHQLQEVLNSERSKNRFEVINAASPGWNAAKLLWRLEHDVMPFEPRVVVIYAAANDIGTVMKGADIPQTSDASLDVLSGWLKRHSVTYNAFRDFTAPYRADAAGAKFKTFPKEGYSYFFKSYKAIIDFCKSNNLSPVLATEAHAFRREQSIEEQQALLGGSSWGLGLEGIYTAHAELNRAIRDLSNTEGVPLVDLARLIEGGRENFSDSIHMTRGGNHKAARLIAEAIASMVADGMLKTGGSDAL